MGGTLIALISPEPELDWFVLKYFNPNPSVPSNSALVSLTQAWCCACSVIENNFQWRRGTAAEKDLQWFSQMRGVQ